MDTREELTEMKHMHRIAALLLAIMLVVVAGCSAGKPPKEALSAAMTKIGKADSYKMNMTFGLNELEIPEDLASQEDAAVTAMVIGMFKDAQITIDGTYQKNPLRMDMNVEVVIPGDMEMKLSVPLKLTEDALYVKIPQIPMLMLPETITGKFIKFDLNELTSQEGMPEIDVEAQKKLSQELSAAVLKHFDEKTYFSQPKPEDAGIPADLKVDQVVAVEINDSNYAVAIDTIIDKALPEVIELLLNNEEYLKLLSLEKADVETFKSDFEANKAEAKETFKKDVKINKLKMISGIQDGYAVYQAGEVNVQAADDELGGTMKIGLDLKMTLTDINKKLELEALPTDVIPSAELEQMFGSALGL
jgi:hypothetical protein